MRRFHLGVVGAGLIAREHALSLVRNPRVGRLTVYDADAGRAQQFAKDFNASAVASLDQLIDGCELLWVCSPPTAHRQAVALACRAKKAIFCEKPLAITMDDARAIRDAVRKARVPFFMGHSNRFSRGFMLMKKLVDQGDIGELTCVWSIRLGYLSPKVHPAWRFEDAKSGGVIVELGIHELDFTRWIGGDWKQAYATGSSATLNPGKFQDAVIGGGPLRKSGAASVNLSWANPRYLWQRGVEGTAASLFFDDSDFNHVQLLWPGKKPRLFPLGYTHWKDEKTGENLTFKDQLNAVMVALEKGAPPPVTLDNGFEALKLALAMRESSRTGKIVPIRAGLSPSPFGRG